MMMVGSGGGEGGGEATMSCFLGFHELVQISD